jgi:hypothetical protein
MTGIEKIPGENRWMISSRSLSALAVSYQTALEETLGEEFLEIEKRIWQERGKEATIYARAFGMPVRNARDIAEAFTTISTLFYGPELTTQLMRTANDVAVIHVTGCPLVKRANEADTEPRRACGSCRAFCTAAVENLNPAYALSHRMSMCQGEEYCQLNIERKE